MALDGERSERVVRLAAYAALVLATLYSIWLGRPDLAVVPGAPYRTDLGGHIVALRHLIEVSLPSGHLLDWSHQWFAGYPSFYFYFPLPALLIAALSLVAPLDIAAKLFAVLAPGLLPAAVYVLVRTTGLGRAQAALGVAGTVAFLSLTTYSVYGGNVIGSVIGEYSYALALAFALFYLAAVAQSARGKRRLPHMALLLSATALSHVIPTLFAVIASGAALRQRTARRDVVAGWLLGFGLSAFWTVPFVVRSPYMGRILWEQRFDLFMVLPIPVLALAPWAIAAGVVLWRSGLRPGLFAALGVAAGVSYLVPHGLFAQARGVPIFHLCTFVLTGIGIATGLMRAYRAQRRAPLTAWTAGLVVLLGVSILQLETVRRQSARLLMSAAPDSAAYQALAGTLARLPVGRVHWEFQPEQGNALGGRVSLASLPGLGSDMRTTIGLFTESALTSPAYVYLLRNLSRDSLGNRIWQLPAPNDTSAARVLARLRQLGVAYHVTFSAESHAWAEAQPYALRPVASHPAWTIWEVAGTRLVEPVERLRGGSGTAEEELATWLTGATDTSTWILAGGLDPGTVSAYGPPKERAYVSNVRLAHREVHFETTALGIPHVVRVGYFPNWRAHGADGPWQVVPGFMIVVPRQQSVTLRFESTWVEWTGRVLSAAAILLLVLGAVRARRRYPGSPARQ